MATSCALKTPFIDAVPPLATAELEELERKIVAAGRVLYPILVTTDDEILDGHNRYAIATTRNLPYDVRVVEESAEWDEDRKRFEVQSLALAQRNLSPDQKRELNKSRDKQIVAKRKEGWTQKRIGEWFGLSRSRVTQLCLDEPSRQRVKRPFGEDERVLASNTSSRSGVVRDPSTDQRVKVNPSAKPAIAARVEAGAPVKQVAADLGVTPQAVKKIVTAEKKLADIRSQREESAKQRTSNCGVITGDFRTFCLGLDDGSVDLILTDPPYDESSVDLYHDLAEIAARVLTPGGWLLTYAGHAHIPRILTALAVDGLEYGWTFCVRHTGGNTRFRKFHLMVGWKPIFAFFKPRLSVDWDWFVDVVSGGKEKELHEWQQAESEAAHFIERLCPQNGLVCDPFCGSGTTLAAAKSLGRKWIGCEIDGDHAETARSRVE